MYTDFYSDKKYIENEYENGEWIENSGIEPDELNVRMRKFIADNPEMPYPIVVANLYKMMLLNMKIAINTHTMFPDRMRHGGKYLRDATASVLEMIQREHYEKTFLRECHAVWSQRMMFAYCGFSIPDTDVWHTVLDWEAVIKLGAKGLYDRAVNAKAEREANGTLDERSEIFLESVIISYGAILEYIKRLRDAAQERGMERYADALTNLLSGAPNTLYEVLCLCHIMLNSVELGRERCRSYGPIDQLYTPFYVADLEAGRESVESVREMFRYFWQKVAAEKRYADQPICIGKAWESDDCPAAEFTTIMLDSYNELKIHNPKIHLIYRKDMSDKLLSYAMNMIRSGNSSLVLVNDEVVLKSYDRLGIPREDSQKYIPIGCYECTIMGIEDSRICAAWINLVKGCEYTITGGYDLFGKVRIGRESPVPESWEEFMAEYYRYLAEHIVIVMNNINQQAIHAYKAHPSPIYSGSIGSCIENARDVFDCGMKYCNQSIKCFAIGTAVDSLLAVKKFVYEDKKVTLPELRDALEKNWEGYEELRAEILASDLKYGNHIKEADDLTHEIFAFCAEHIIGKPTSTGGVFRLGCDSVNMSDVYGARSGASADGRRANEPLSKNMRPVNGMEKKGISAFVQSVCSIEDSIFSDGAPLDFIMHPSAVEGDAGLEAMKATTRLFMKNGGMAFQGNILDLETLLDAREHPEKYPTLQVRVCGWNEYFVNMNKKVQDDFIARVAGLEK